MPKYYLLQYLIYTRLRRSREPRCDTRSFLACLLHYPQYHQNYRIASPTLERFQLKVTRNSCVLWLRLAQPKHHGRVSTTHQNLLNKSLCGPGASRKNAHFSAHYCCARELRRRNDAKQHLHNATLAFYICICTYTEDNDPHFNEKRHEKNLTLGDN